MKGYGVWIGVAAVAAAAGLYRAAVPRGPTSAPLAAVSSVQPVQWIQAASPSASPAPSGPVAPAEPDTQPFTVDLAKPSTAGPTPVASPAVTPTLATLFQPITLDESPPNDDENVYVEPPPPPPGEGVNNGGVNNDLTLTYFNHYIYRGVDHSITASNGSANSQKSKGTSLNLEINDRLEFNLGNWPHPFVGIFTNVYDADPKSRFQEIRPFYGADLTVRPLTFEGGGNSYFYPQREKRDTAEYYGQITLDDSSLINSDRPFLSPYIYGAYDYHRSNGWYFEAGVSHEIPLEDFGLSFDFQADAAYIMGFNQQFVFNDSEHDTGFQHYDVGMTTTYSLTRALNIPPSYGTFNLKGYLFYTGKLNPNLRADNVLWGGVGIEFKY